VVRLPWSVADTLAAPELIPKLKPLWEAFQAQEAYATIHETIRGTYSKREQDGWRVDFDGWGARMEKDLP